MGKKLEPEKEHKIREAYVKGLGKIEKIAKAAGCSVGAVHRRVRSLDAEIKALGLIPVLDKYGLTDVKNALMTQAVLDENKATAQEVIQGILLIRVLVPAGIKPEEMLIVIDQVFSKATPETAPAVGAAIVEYARERARNGNLTIDQLRTEYHNRAENCTRLSEKERTLSGTTTHLQSQVSSLNENVNMISLKRAALSQRLASAGQTDQSLRVYLWDKANLKQVGVDTADFRRAGQFFAELKLHGYDASFVVAQLLNVPALSAASRLLTGEVTDLVNRKTKLSDDIAQLENRKKQAALRAEQAEKDADAKIAASQKRVEDRLAEEKLTMTDIDDSKRFREELRQAGFED